MKLALNYSPAAAALLAGDTMAGVDAFKCPPWPAVMTEAELHLPIYVHFELSTCDGSIQAARWDWIERTLTRTGTPFVNLHLRAPVGAFAGRSLEARSHDHVERVVERVMADVGLVAKRFGPARVVLENVLYRGAASKTLYPVVDPAVITRIVAATGCGLLLDVAHARITADTLGTDVRDYVSGLPLQVLRELHVTGVRWDGQILRDSMALSEADWDVAAWALGEIHARRWHTPWAVAFEYGGVGPIFDWRSDPQVLSRQVPDLHDLVRSAAACAR